MKPLSTLFFLLVLSPLSFYYISLKLSSSPHGIAYTQLEVCENPSQPGPFSPPQVYAPEGIRTEWFGGRSKGGMACMLVDVFTTLLFPHTGYLSAPAPRTMILYFFAYIPTALFFINLSLTTISLPILIPIFGIAYQLFSAGFVLSLLSAYAVNRPALFRPRLNASDSTNGKDRGKEKMMATDSVDVEAVLVGVLVGCCLPTYMIWKEATQGWTLAWQGFPVWAWLAQMAYAGMMRRVLGRKRGDSPTVALGMSYVVLGGISLAAHLPLVHHLLTSSSPSSHSFRSLFLPDFAFSATARSHTEAIQACLQYDLIFTVLAFYALFSLRSNGSAWRKIKIGLMCVAGTVLGGPGAGTMIGWEMGEEGGKRDGGKED